MDFQITRVLGALNQNLIELKFFSFVKSLHRVERTDIYKSTKIGKFGTYSKDEPN